MRLYEPEVNLTVITREMDIYIYTDISIQCFSNCGAGSQQEGTWIPLMEHIFLGMGRTLGQVETLFTRSQDIITFIDPFFF